MPVGRHTKILSLQPLPPTEHGAQRQASQWADATHDPSVAYEPHGGMGVSASPTASPPPSHATSNVVNPVRLPQAATKAQASAPTTTPATIRDGILRSI